MKIKEAALPGLFNEYETSSSKEIRRNRVVGPAIRVCKTGLMRDSESDTHEMAILDITSPYQRRYHGSSHSIRSQPSSFSSVKEKWPEQEDLADTCGLSFFELPEDQLFWLLCS
ncbi:hypothetical protein CB1_001428078 [Camelus ferus]|nr:hypothetical protein CB1_001428078 [Camelus ferus]